MTSTLESTGLLTNILISFQADHAEGLGFASKRLADARIANKAQAHAEAHQTCLLVYVIPLRDVGLKRERGASYKIEIKS